MDNVMDYLIDISGIPIDELSTDLCCEINDLAMALLEYFIFSEEYSLDALVEDKDTYPGEGIVLGILDAWCTEYALVLDETFGWIQQRHTGCHVESVFITRDFLYLKIRPN